MIDVARRREDELLQRPLRGGAQRAHNLRILSRENGAQIEFEFAPCDVADDRRRAAPESRRKILKRDFVRPQIERDRGNDRAGQTAAANLCLAFADRSCAAADREFARAKLQRGRAVRRW